MLHTQIPEKRWMMRWWLPHEPTGLTTFHACTHSWPVLHSFVHLKKQVYWLSVKWVVGACPTKLGGPLSFDLASAPRAHKNGQIWQPWNQESWLLFSHSPVYWRKYRWMVQYPRGAGANHSSRRKISIKSSLEVKKVPLIKISGKKIPVTLV